MRLPQLDEKPVKVHPLVIERFSEGFFEVERVSDGRAMFGDVDRDLVKTSMGGCDGSERRGHPYSGQISGPHQEIYKSADRAEISMLSEVQHVNHVKHNRNTAQADSAKHKHFLARFNQVFSTF